MCWRLGDPTAIKSHRLELTVVPGESALAAEVSTLGAKETGNKCPKAVVRTGDFLFFSLFSLPMPQPRDGCPPPSRVVSLWCAVHRHTQHLAKAQGSFSSSPVPHHR